MGGYFSGPPDPSGGFDDEFKAFFDWVKEQSETVATESLFAEWVGLLGDLTAEENRGFLLDFAAVIGKGTADQARDAGNRGRERLGRVVGLPAEGLSALWKSPG